MNGWRFDTCQMFDKGRCEQPVAWRLWHKGKPGQNHADYFCEEHSRWYHEFWISEMRRQGFDVAIEAYPAAARQLAMAI